MADELLRALGRVQRAQQAEQARAGDEPWARPLDADEQADILAAVLGAGAAPTANDASPTGPALDTRPTANDASPTGPATDASPTGPALGAAPTANDASPTGPALGARPTANDASPTPAASGATVVPLARARARRGWLAGAATLAVAAALLLFVRFGGDEGAGGPALPTYAITRASGELSARGTEPADAPIVLRADTAIDWLLAPATATREPVDVRVIAAQGEERRWIAAGEARTISGDGVIRLRGRAGAWLGLSPGTWTLTLVIGRPEALPADLEAFARGVDRPQERGWQLQRVQVQVEG